jgi:hypothetical protein
MQRLHVALNEGAAGAAEQRSLTVQPERPFTKAATAVVTIRAAR